MENVTRSERQLEAGHAESGTSGFPSIILLIAVAIAFTLSALALWLYVTAG